MKQMMAICIAMMLFTSCAYAQSEWPELMLRDIRDQSKVVYEIEGGAVYESGSEEDGTYLCAWYDDFGYLDNYIFHYDCGCEIWYEGSGRIDVANSNNQCGHTAPVKHEYMLQMPDEDLLKMLKELTGKTHTLEYLKTPAVMGELTWGADKKSAVLEDKGYDDVILRDGTAPCQTVSKDTQGGKTYWKFTFKRPVDFEDVWVIIKQDGKLSYFRDDGSAVYVELGNYCEYDVETETFWLNAGYRYNAFAEYDGNGRMYEYGYHKSGVTEYSCVYYNMQNELTYAAFADELGREWLYTTGNGWLLYDEDSGEDVSSTPDEIALASVLPPIKKQQYTVPAATHI